MPVAKKTEEKSEGKIKFFGEIDLNDDGKIRSDMPAWYLDRQIEELEEDVVKKEGAIRRQQVTGEAAAILREQIKADKARLKVIESGRPKLTGNQKDRCYNVYKSIAQQIGDSMPTRKQTKDGLVNPYNELKRLKTKHIKIDPEIAAACGAKPIQGKITGDEAVKCYQIIGKAIGENTNAEALRKDGGVPSYQTSDDLTKLILDKFKES